MDISCQLLLSVPKYRLSYIARYFIVYNHVIIRQTRRMHSYSSNPRRVAALALTQILIFDLLTPKPCHLGYPKVIPYTEFERWDHSFWVMLRTSRKTSRRTRTSYPRRPTESPWIMKNALSWDMCRSPHKYC